LVLFNKFYHFSKQILTFSLSLQIFAFISLFFFYQKLSITQQ